MKLHRLLIERRSSYESDSPLVGKVTLKSSHGEQTVTLSAGALNEIFRLVAAEVGKTACTNASRATDAMHEAGQEALLIENDGQLTIE